jgi:predicted Zn-dependent protease
MKPVAAGLLCALLLLAASRVSAHQGEDHTARELSRHIQNHPGSQSLHIARAASYTRAAQWQRAELDLQRAEALGDPVDVAFNRGLLAFEQADHASARQWFSHYLQRYPNHPQALRYRARAAREQGDPVAAGLDYRQLLESAATPQPGDYLVAARVMADPAVGNTAQALAILDQGLSRLGSQAQLQRLAVTLELRAGRPAAALSRWQTLAPALGQSPAWQLEMAQLLLQTGQPEQAGHWLEKARMTLSLLRNTPARQRLRSNIEALQQEIGNA